MEKLQNDDMRTVLDAVDDLRAVGINSIIPLPQIVACGDQSSGKSSLLEALTGIPFPRDTGLCTRFATQFILRRADKVSISVTIIPGPNRIDQDERQRLEAFGRGKTFDPTELGELIEDATRVMGLPPLTGDPKNIRAFSHDVLSIAISGPDRPSLTLVDTPGLIKSKGKYQSVEDIKTIETLVKSYINQDSTILLSVLSATYQRELQQIPSMITENAAIRTLGIITKPDGPGPDTALEREYIELAQNQLLPLGHGWHVVKNRSEKEMHFTMSQRDQSEKSFFAKSKWTKLNSNQLGVPALNNRLARLLCQHVQAAIPGLQDSLTKKLKEVNVKLDKLGPGRGTNLEHRGLLVEIASNFQRLAEVAIDGNYKKDPWFGMSPRKASTEYTTDGHRLRALVQDKHRQFSHAIRVHGSKYDITQTPAEWDSSGSNNDLLGFANTVLEYPYNSFASDQKVMTYASYITHVQTIEKRFRGTQLSGIFNPDIVDELFHEQSSRWSDLARAHIDNVNDYCKDFVAKLLSQIAPPDIAERLEARIDSTLEQRRKKALKELEKFLRVERGVLMTYDPNFTITIERLRTERMERKTIEGTKPPNADATSGGSPARGLKMPRIDTKTQINIDGLAAEDALTVSWVYYRSQREHFVAYLTKHIIEPCMVEGLDKILSPKEFGSMPITETRSLAVEAEELVEERKQLLRKKQILEKGKAKFDAALEKKDGHTKVEPEVE
ncbi:hypothetical protein E4T49_01852 [Aureobasidium sp. EXF-10728]|nr:hypothetical protein E4T49_01852 [Aureobasidium sp. EXF-10728]